MERLLVFSKTIGFLIRRAHPRRRCSRHTHTHALAKKENVMQRQRRRERRRAGGLSLLICEYLKGWDALSCKPARCLLLREGGCSRFAPRTPGSPLRRPRPRHCCCVRPTLCLNAVNATAHAYTPNRKFDFMLWNESAAGKASGWPLAPFVPISNQSIDYFRRYLPLWRATFLNLWDNSANCCAWWRANWLNSLVYGIEYAFQYYVRVFRIWV